MQNSLGVRLRRPMREFWVFDQVLFGREWFSASYSFCIPSGYCVGWKASLLLKALLVATMLARSAKIRALDDEVGHQANFAWYGIGQSNLPAMQPSEVTA